MEITDQSIRHTFNININKLLRDMQHSFDSGQISNNIPDFQRRLDKLASIYQNNEHLGKLRYKLYEAQAYIHYFQHDNDKALEFIQMAISTRGERFNRADNLINEISDSSYQEGVVDTQPPKLSSTKIKWVVGIAGAILILGVIYWLAIRPVLVRHSCNSMALTHIGYTNPQEAAFNDIYQSYYDTCLINHGLSSPQPTF